GKRYFLFWLGSQSGTRSALRMRTVDISGNPLTAAVDLASAGSGKTFDALNVTRNPKNGSMMAILLQANSISGAVLKVNITADGKLQGAPATFQGLTAGLRAVGDATFSTPGIGFGFWSDKDMIKRRKVTATGTFGSGVAAIANTADVNSIQTSIAYNAVSTQFAGVWAKGNQTFVTYLNGTTGAPVKAPAAIATSTLGFSQNPAIASDAAGNVLIVWEDSTGNALTAGPTVNYRVRAAVIAQSDS